MTNRPNPLPPGPYRFEMCETADTYRIFAADSDQPMAEMIYIGGGENFAEPAKALAQLFAASPKLLDALVALRDEVTSYGLHHPGHQAQFMPDETLEVVDDAIRATGNADWTEQDGQASEKEGWGISWAIGVSGENAEEYRLERVHSGPELLRLLKQNGFEVISVRGSHYKLRHPDGREVILPFCQSQYPKATYFSILKDAGLRTSDLRREKAGAA